VKNRKIVFKKSQKQLPEIEKKQVKRYYSLPDYQRDNIAIRYTGILVNP
jgi:hypothetical protein